MPSHNLPLKLAISCGFIAVRASALDLPTEFLEGLGKEDFRVREEAQHRLLSWARDQTEPSLDSLYEYSQHAADPEVRERCLAVLRQLVNDRYFAEGEGYLGVQLSDTVEPLPGGKKNSILVRIVMVQAGGPAEKAGLLAGDRFIEIHDGNPVFFQNQLELQTAIRRRKPNGVLKIKVLRGDERVEASITLGRRPAMLAEMFFDGQPVDPATAERKAQENYFRQWIAQKKGTN